MPSDILGSVGASETIYFTIDEPMHFLIEILIVVAILVIISVITLYYKKNRAKSSVVC